MGSWIKVGQSCTKIRERPFPESTESGNEIVRNEDFRFKTG